MYLRSIYLLGTYLNLGKFTWERPKAKRERGNGKHMTSHFGVEERTF